MPAAYILRRVLIKSVRAHTDLMSTRRNMYAAGIKKKDKIKIKIVTLIGKRKNGFFVDCIITLF